MYLLEEEAGSADCTQEGFVAVSVGHTMTLHGPLVRSPERAQLADVSHVLSMCLPDMIHHRGPVSEPAVADATNERALLCMRPQMASQSSFTKFATADRASVPWHLLQSHITVNLGSYTGFGTRRFNSALEDTLIDIEMLLHVW